MTRAAEGPANGCGGRQARAWSRPEMVRQLIEAAGAGVMGLWREMTITRNAGGENGIAGIEAGNR